VQRHTGPLLAGGRKNRPCRENLAVGVEEALNDGTVPPEAVARDLLEMVVPVARLGVAEFAEHRAHGRQLGATGLDASAGAVLEVAAR
jgi:hypothetical protein